VFLKGQRRFPTPVTMGSKNLPLVFTILPTTSTIASTTCKADPICSYITFEYTYRGTDSYSTPLPLSIRSYAPTTHLFAPKPQYCMLLVKATCRILTYILTRKILKRMPVLSHRLICSQSPIFYHVHHTYIHPENGTFVASCCLIAAIPPSTPLTLNSSAPIPQV
jgi:hypothetical protein